MHPFVALMRKYCIDYTNSHDQSVCDEIMEPDYVVHICGAALTRDESYKPAARRVFDEYPGLGLIVHEIVTNGERLALRFSEHGAAVSEGGRTAVWNGIGLYKWNGRRLTENFVEQDFAGRALQFARGEPNEVEPPHVDAWGTKPAAPNPAREEAMRRWLSRGDLRLARAGVIDDGAVDAHKPVLAVESVRINDLFSASDRVAFHATHIGRITDEAQQAELHIAGLARVDDDGAVAHLRAVTDRFGMRMRLPVASKSAL
jgi:hypothetical protein